MPDDDGMLRRLELDLDNARADLRRAEEAADLARRKIHHIDGLLQGLRRYLAGDLTDPHAPPAEVATSSSSDAQAVEDLILSHRGEP